MKQMKHFRVLLTFLLALTLTGCGIPAETATVRASKSPETTEAQTSSGTNEPIKVVTTLFPQYDFTRVLAGDRATVTLLLPPGVESHSFEPTPKDIVEISHADLFIFTGEGMEPWAASMLSGIESASLTVVDASMGISLVEGEAHDHEGTEHADADHEEAEHADADHEEEEHADADHEEAEHADADHEEEHDHEHEGGLDPHIWLDPLLARQMVANIADALIDADPSGESVYRANEEAYLKELDALHAAFEDAFSKVARKNIVYGGHFAFGYFARRYGLTHTSPYAGFAPDAEPTPRRIAELVDLMKESQSTTIYYEELVDPKVAEVISDATGAEMVLLHGAHNLTRDELANGASYIGIMRDNLEKLKKGLGYHE